MQKGPIAADAVIAWLVRVPAKLPWIAGGVAWVKEYDEPLCATWNPI